MDGDLWAEISKRFPAKSLCLLQSVCKDWKSVISSAYFINLHRSFTYDLRRPLKYSIKRLHCPFQAHEGFTLKRFTFVDVIRGVVCISCYRSSIRPCPSPDFNTLLLWNPSIHKYVALPCLALPRHFGLIGFGYDTRKNDVKVVLIRIRARGLSPLNRLTYRVCSARQGLWRPPVTTSVGTLEDLVFKTDACFVNGTIHWLVTSGYNHHLLMFDCETEEWRSIDVPVEHLWLSEAVSPRKVGLLEYGGMLAALVEHTTIPARIELWVMEEHGVSNSWKKPYEFSWANCGLGWRINNSSIDHENLAPYNNSTIYKGYYEDIEELMDYRVYEENMSLMDHPQVRSYTKEGTVKIPEFETHPPS